MAFSFGNSGNTAISGGEGGIQTGPDLEEIQTEALSFLSLSGESKVQLLPTPWPSDNLPPPTASLMSVASHKGLVAAAGPDAVILATTESVRKAFEGAGSGDGNFKPFQPQLKLPMPMRISQLAFSADESYLVLSAEVGGGLAVYDVQALLQGSTQSSFELSTNGQALRALVPNPTAEKGELFAVITNDGNLMMANLKERNFVPGPNGQVLKDGVSCLSWSTKGKQLVAGLGNGTAYQMTPEGVGKGDIPRPPSVDNNHHVSSITWLENHVFLLVHTPSNVGGDPPSSIFNIVTRQPPSSFIFQKITEPVGPFGLNRSPPHHFLLRLREFPPNLQDLVIVASTASSDIGLFSRSKVPLTKDKPADKITGVFTMTEMMDDSRRAILPMTGDLNDTSPIGLALDLSSKEKVVKPIPSDEMDESPSPLPALMVLNNEGVLASWWIVYSESIRQKTIYPGLVTAGATLQQYQQPQASTAPAQTQTPAFGGSSTSGFGQQSASGSAFGASKPITSFGGATGAFGAPSGLGQRTSVWGTPSASTATPINTLAFGSSASGPKPATSTSSSAFRSSVFGSNPATSKLPSAFGASPFGSTTAPAVSASTPTFGSTSGPSFGTSGLPGNRTSVWGSAASTTQGSSFGQPTGIGKSASVFGSGPPSTGTPASPSGGFASFASKGGFAVAAATPSASGSIFGSKPTSIPFSTSGTGSEMDTSIPFGGSSNIGNKPSGVFGGSDSSNNFVLNSTFKADRSAKGEEPESSNGSKSSFFGGNFGRALGDVAKTPVAEIPVSNEADMDSTEEPPKPGEQAKLGSTTPASTPAPAPSPFFTTAPLGSGGLFGTSRPATSPTTTKIAASAGFSFGKATADSPKSGLFSFAKTNSGLISASKPLTPTTQTPIVAASAPSPKIKEEPSSDGESGSPNNRITEPPLPPDSTSKTSYGAGDTSVSSTETDAPLPPDFIPKSFPTAAPKPVESPLSPVAQESIPTPIHADLIPLSDIPGGPEDDDNESGFGSEDEDEGDESEPASEEGSGEDVAKDISPISENNQTPGFTPQSSFGGLNDHSPDSLFTKIPKPGQTNIPPSRQLFGEGSAPSLPPPKVQASPRSPSPVRTALPSRMLRPDGIRSVSAPGIASQLLGRKPATQAPSQSTFALSLQQQKAEEQRREEIRARKEAEEKQALVDNEDEDMQKFLSSDLKATRTLDEFVAHADYVAPPSKDSIVAQVETVYRDINSMIDTLGVNARSLKSFIKGHTEQYKEEGRTREDLEIDDDWCLVEIDDLSSLVERQLTRELENGRVKDVAIKLETCNDLQKDLIRLRAKHEDIKKILAAQSDLSHLAFTRAQPLSAEQAAQQHDLRRDFTKFQKLLSEAEEGLTVLKAKIVSQATSNGKANGSAGPTVEAVMRTIAKMTSMAEKRSGDIDVLEGQMRKLRFSSTASNGSREGSPFATPQNNRSSQRNPGTSNTYGLFYTPDSIKDTSRGFQNSLVSSTSSLTRSSPPRKKMSGYTADEKAHLKTKLARKKEVTDRLKHALQKSGTNVRLMDDEE